MAEEKRKFKCKICCLDHGVRVCKFKCLGKKKPPLLNGTLTLCIRWPIKYKIAHKGSPHNAPVRTHTTTYTQLRSHFKFQFIKLIIAWTT